MRSKISRKRVPPLLPRLSGNVNVWRSSSLRIILTKGRTWGSSIVHPSIWPPEFIVSTFTVHSSTSAERKLAQVMDNYGRWFVACGPDAVLFLFTRAWVCWPCTWLSKSCLNTMIWCTLHVVVNTRSVTSLICLTIQQDQKFYNLFATTTKSLE